MKNLALPRIKEMRIYSPPLGGRRAFSGILLDFNERTLSPSPKVARAIRNLLKSNKLQLYPEYGKLEKKLAQYAGVGKDQIMITNGSDQAIDIVLRTFTEKGDKVIIPTPSFAMFYQSAQILGNKIITPLYERSSIRDSVSLYKKENLSFPLDEVLEKIDDLVKIIVVCNPNNPTGTLISIKDIEKIAQKAQNSIILVDEAYFEFSKVTAVPLIKKYQNIIVARTLSKAFGLPSLRIGYIVASKIYIGELLKVRGPYDVNMVAEVAATASLDDLKAMQKYTKEVTEIAKPMVEEFFAQNSITFYQSYGNFLLYKPRLKKEEKLLKENGILVRPQDKTNIEKTLRLSIGTEAQMRRFIKVYQKVILDEFKPKRYAFLDRDGTLIFEPQDTYQIDSLKKLKILDGVIKGLKKLTKKGYQLIMVTNQDGLGTSALPKANFEAPQNKLLSFFKENGINFKKIFICPHLPSENCDCRKPKIGLLKKFLRENTINKSQSFVCGDRTTDKLFAKNLGIKFISVTTNGDFYNSLAQGGIL
ncbi:histidinol-phosphate transaminase [Candidatus Daviesbacteria bacterium]|nr:histidinol-phosphate transaminase [Candidatus Daviesbacteria bacterium]